MKTKPMLLAVLSVSAIAITGAYAQPRQQAPYYDAWCRDIQTGLGGSVMICRGYTYQQCMASRSSHVESCYLNPLYDPRFADWRRRNPNY